MTITTTETTEALAAGSVEQALSLAARGWEVFPLMGKQPLTAHGFLDAVSDDAAVRALWALFGSAATGVGIATGQASGFWVLDVDDHRDGDNGHDTLDALVDDHARLPETVEVVTGSGGRHLYFKSNGTVGSTADVAPGLDVRGGLADGSGGGYVVAPGSRHPETGRLYEWEASSHPDHVEIAEAPQWLIELVTAPAKATATQEATSTELEAMVHDWTVTKTLRNGDRYLRRPGKVSGDHSAVLHAPTESYPGGRLHVFSGRAPIPQGSYGTYVSPYADLNVEEFLTKEEPSQTLGRNRDTELFPWTDVGNASRFADAVKDHLRYVPAWNAWLVWTGSRWRRDDLNTPKRLATDLAKSIWHKAADGGRDEQAWAQRVNSHSGVASMVELAKSDQRLVVSVESLDKQPFLLPVANGVVDLRTGRLLEPDRGDLLTAGSDVTYDPAAKCPTFDRFLAEVLPSQTLRDFVQRALGYTLTGSTREQCLFFAYGGGKNGKSTLLYDVASFILGHDLATPSPQGFLTSRTVTPHDIASLHGKRLLVAAETDQGGKINEPRVKEVTGGDRLEGAHKYGHHFSFTPTHTVWIMSNYKPRITGTDDGIWRRMLLVPFTVQIPEAKRDTLLPEKLQAEAPGILAWLVRGAKDWHATSLRPPQEVTQATDAYRRDQDVLGQFIDERLRFAFGLKASSTDMNAALDAWCRTADVDDVPSSKALATRLLQRGLDEPKASNGRRWWSGVGILKDSDADDWASR